MAITRKEQDNVLRWDRRRGWYEVYYLKWNDVASRTAYWIRYTLTSPLPKVGDPYCELWGIFFDITDPKKNFAVKNRFPIDKLSWDTDKFRVAISDAELTQNACHAKIVDEKNNNSLSWNLAFDSEGPTSYLFPSEAFYKGSFPKTKAMMPHQHAIFNGTITANGREIKIANAPGQQTHLWGTKHSLRWAWGHCNTFKEEPGAVWEGIDAQIKLGPVPSPHFKLFYLKTEGKEYHFNRLPNWFGNKSTWRLGHWTFECKNEQIKVKGEITSRLEDFVAVTYMDPDGEFLWCNNSKVASLRLSIYSPQGAHIKDLSSEYGSAAEFVDRKTYPEVPVRI